VAIFDDSPLAEDPGNVELIRPVGKRRITHAIHDVDGTHSLIRQWQPVMSLIIHWAMTCGLGEDFDSPGSLAALAGRVGREELPETDRFCVESAGLSALTQMEFGIRRAIELGNVPPELGRSLTPEQRRANAEIIRRIWDGQERFDDVPQPPELVAFIEERTPRLFRLYEALLNHACRDRNTAEARRDPAKWRVPGSMEFLRHLHAVGCVNYFVTGAVIYADGGMLEEVRALGYEIGPGRTVEALLGSSWDRKLPKDEVMRRLCREEGIDPRNVLAVGDGRTEIAAAAAMGCVTISRLDPDAARQRELHISLGTNYILPDYTHPALKRALQRE